MHTCIHDSMNADAEADRKRDGRMIMLKDHVEELCSD